ncbi:adenylyl-sulfate kinase [Petrotoga sp. 9PWA.NaAc.5.4]|uniref:adenylyl-sulfate kinase n=1 Tax=Petrotoga sp. 9PWA.NaAc.5.4 TaxID=1434328 RepID=UPI000CA9FE19|nr:adenylyl-sulfate kinase [Petrotoga sp. 9PWA.NaAc.5.4]PNR97048.1 adenylylsulfate kinase [Petrotoga sp. 9PWA.NaAc.5.4]
MERKKSENVVWHEGKIKKEDRERFLRQKGVILWLTGLSGSGKSTIAHELEYRLLNMGHLAYVLDGDNIRHGLNGDLGFSPQDREENIRRIGEVAKLFADLGIIAITAFISPYKKDRQRVRSLVKEDEFVEIYVKCSIDVLKQRDTKGMYEKALRGEIKEFTGVSAPYEEPENPELVLNTEKESVEESVNKVLEYLKNKKII